MNSIYTHNFFLRMIQN